MGREGFRTVRFDIEEDLIKKIEDGFCFAVIENERVKVRHLSSVIREAILRGLKSMIVEQIELRKIYNTDLIFLTEGGVLFGDDLLRELKLKDSGVIE